MAATPFQFTCYTCHVAFRDPGAQREHYKTDWHNYNLKRKVADLPPVRAETFNERVLQQKAIAEAEDEKSPAYCKPCKKAFGTQNAYQSHLQSKKHEDNLLRLPKKPAAEQPESDDDMEVEEVDSDEWDESEGFPIPPNTCLFCSTESEDLESNLEHMSVAHSFFVPDLEYVTNLIGLMSYLGEKVGRGAMCLWCNDRGRRFDSVQAVQQHMVGKGHCMVRHEGETLLEYSPYYDYSTSYPDQERDKDEEVDADVATTGDELQLILPSGRSVVHRELLRFYRHRLSTGLALPENRARIALAMAKYRSLGWTGTTREHAKKTARDLNFMNMVRKKQMVKLEVKANKLQNYRPQIRF